VRPGTAAGQLVQAVAVWYFVLLFVGFYVPSRARPAREGPGRIPGSTLWSMAHAIFVMGLRIISPPHRRRGSACPFEIVLTAKYFSVVLMWSAPERTDTGAICVREPDVLRNLEAEGPVYRRESRVATRAAGSYHSAV